MKQYSKILEAINNGIKLALDDYQNIELSNSFDYNDTINSKNNIKELIELKKITVDLGLPSGTLWCKYNLGVNSNKLNETKNWYGKYYAWGEIKPKHGYTWENYKYSGKKTGVTKYCDDVIFGKNAYTDNLTQLLIEDDAAYQNIKFYNFKFHIPTKELFEELIRYTNNKEVNNYLGINELNGHLFIGKNGNELFFPFAGLYYYSKLDKINEAGHYWSANIHKGDPNRAWYFYCQKNYQAINNFYCRCAGFPIRPVILKN